MVANVTGGFVHNIDPVLTQIGPFYLWWYGFAYTLGFLGIFLWLRYAREPLGLSLAQVYDLAIMISASVLIGGRLVEVIFYEWGYYGQHLPHIAAYWLGGMSTHGILAGSAVGIWWFARRRGVSFLEITDELVIPGAFFMGVGRIGNFVDGQIVGAPADVWWAVKFPDTEGYRHPVVLYDGLKNLLLVPLLLLFRRAKPPPGILTAQFIFWYGILRFLVDQFREYRVSLFGLGPGQAFNLMMALAGLLLMWWCWRRARHEGAVSQRVGSRAEISPADLWSRRLVLTLLLLFPLIIPSDWTQDVPARYGERHPGMEHSRVYPVIKPAATE